MAMTFYPHSHFPGPHHSALWPRVVIYPTPMHGMLSYHARMHVCIRDGLNAVFSGVLRGSGQQLTGAAVSGSCFLFSLPTTYYLAFIADWSMLSGVPILGALEPVCLRVIHPPTQCPSRSSKVSASIRASQSTTKTHSLDVPHSSFTSRKVARVWLGVSAGSMLQSCVLLAVMSRWDWSKQAARVVKSIQARQ